ncbi:hypothetical protein TNCV_3844061 [Trichonephila clavipes]|nr:hypothetical protein TNCV_3844061 [Trichonephila clavipes]
MKFRTINQLATCDDRRPCVDRADLNSSEESFYSDASSVMDFIPSIDSPSSVFGISEISDLIRQLASGTINCISRTSLQIYTDGSRSDREYLGTKLVLINLIFLIDFSSNHRVHFLWVPSHVEIDGNEKADFLARTVAEEEPGSEDISRVPLVLFRARLYCPHLDLLGFQKGRGPSGPPSVFRLAWFFWIYGNCLAQCSATPGPRTGTGSGQGVAEHCARQSDRSRK